MSRRFFGTDGIRGRVGQEPMTPEFVMKLGWAVGKVLSRQDKGHVVIGKDTRISGYIFESSFEAGLAASGVDVTLMGPMPTPAVAYMTQAQRAIAGIVISASLIAASLVLDSSQKVMEFTVNFLGVHTISITALLGLLGYTLATALGFWLIISIFRSGKM